MDREADENSSALSGLKLEEKYFDELTITT